MVSRARSMPKQNMEANPCLPSKGIQINVSSLARIPKLTTFLDKGVK
jgi:hypothetical protein